MSASSNTGHVSQDPFSRQVRAFSDVVRIGLAAIRTYLCATVFRHAQGCRSIGGLHFGVQVGTAAKRPSTNAIRYASISPSATLATPVARRTNTRPLADRS